MKKRVIYILSILSFIANSSSALEVENNTTISNYVDFTASLRYYSMVRKYDEYVEETTDTYLKQRSSNAIGGAFGFKTKAINHWSVGATLYTSQPVFHNPKDEGGLQVLQNDQSGYTVLGEAYIEYQNRYNLFKIGRQRLSDYQFLSDSDSRMTPYTYEAAIFENRRLEDIVLRAAVVSGVKTHASTEYIDFVNASKNLLRERVVDRNPIRGDYDPNNFDANGNYIGPQENLYLVSMVYNDKKSDVALWNYYVPDFVNFFYATVSYKFSYRKWKNSIGLEYIQQNDVGDHVAGDINTYAYGLQLNSKYENFSFTYSFNKVKYDENSLDGGTIIDMWGGGLIYAGLFYNGADQAGTVANSIILSYDFESYPFAISAFAGIYDLPNDMYDLFAQQDNKEYDFVFHYLPQWNKKLTMKLELIYVDFETGYNFKEYEALHGYDLLHTFDNILDMRFIVNYTF